MEWMNRDNKEKRNDIPSLRKQPAHRTSLFNGARRVTHGGRKNGGKPKEGCCLFVLFAVTCGFLAVAAT